MSADSMVPSAGNPQSLNRYSYNYNNPVKYVDPSGHKPCEDDNCTNQPSDDTCIQEPSRCNEVDWELAWMRKAANSPEAADIAATLRASDSADLGGILIGIERTSLFVEANLKFAAMVKTKGPWDIKETAQRQYEDTFQVGDKSYTYEISGNILYGYVGIKVGFDSTWLQGAAGAAQIWDHRSDPQTIGPPTTFFDEPHDNAAIRAGIDLYKSYGDKLNRSQFIDTVNKYNADLNVQNPGVIYQNWRPPWRAN